MNYKKYETLKLVTISILLFTLSILSFSLAYLCFFEYENVIMYLPTRYNHYHTESYIASSNYLHGMSIIGGFICLSLAIYSAYLAYVESQRKSIKKKHKQ